jgi:hypothetical protein
LPCARVEDIAGDERQETKAVIASTTIVLGITTTGTLTRRVILIAPGCEPLEVPKISQNKYRHASHSEIGGEKRIYQQ